MLVLFLASVAFVVAIECPGEIQPTDGLILIDVQNGFMEAVPLQDNPEYPLGAEDIVDGHVRPGSLAVKDSSQIVAPIQEWISEFEKAGAPIFVSVDWHENNHCSFCRDGTNQPSTRICPEVGPNHPAGFNSTGRCTDALAVRAFNANELVQWPDHCVAGTFSSRLTPFLRLPDNAIIVKKGFVPHLDSYSAFGGALSEGWPEWNVNETQAQLSQRPSLSQLLAMRNVNRVFVMGLASDFCVKMTSIDAINENFGPVVMVSSASRGVTPAGVEAAIKQMSSLGIWVTGPDSLSVAQVMEEVVEACEAAGEPSNNNNNNNNNSDSKGSVNTALVVLTVLLACTTLAVAVYAYIVRRSNKEQRTIVV